MILDRIENASQYFCMGPQWQTALTAIQQYDPAQFVKGEKIMLDNGVKLLQFEPTTKPREKVIFEAHRKFADIMFFPAGEEKIAWKPTAELKNITTQYTEEKEALLAELDDDAVEIPMKPGMFIVFLPQDAHGPDIAVKEPAAVRRCVVKVPLD